MKIQAGALQPSGTSESHERLTLGSRALYLMLAKTLALGFAIALPLFLTRHLTRTEFGLYKQVFLILNTAVALLPLGFHMSAFYFLPRAPEHRGQIVFNIFLFNLLTGSLGCLALVLFPGLPGRLFHSEQAAQYSPYLGVLILFWVAPSFLEMLAVANQDTYVSSFLIVGAQFSKTALLLSAAVFFSTILSLIYAAILQGILQVIALLIYLRNRFPGYWRGFQWPVLREQLSYALPFGFAGLLYSIQLDLHNYVVANQFSADLFAVYSIGCFQLPLIGILSESVTSVMIPRVSALQKCGDTREILALAARAMRKLALVFFPTYFFLLATGPDFLTCLFTERYRQSWPVFAVNLTLLPLYIVVVDPLTRAYAEQRHYLLRLYIVLFILQAACLLPAVRFFGLVGAILVVVLVNIALRAVLCWRLAGLLKATWVDLGAFQDLGKIALAASVAGAATWLLRHTIVNLRPFFILFYSAILFSLLYACGLLVMRVLTSEEVGMMRYWRLGLKGRTPGLAITRATPEQ
jgi:O-antigen/teichoic acid export membrane protein